MSDRQEFENRMICFDFFRGLGYISVAVIDFENRFLLYIVLK
jgi:hypothetical protein